MLKKYGLIAISFIASTILCFSFIAPLQAALETQLLVDVSPSSDNVPYTQTQWYGFAATGGNGYCAILTPSTGNGDLYLFDTGFNLRTSSKNTGLTADKVWYGQSTTGPFHLACYGAYNPSSNFTIQVITAPYVSTMSPTSGASGTLVTINGFGFGATRGTSYVKFGTVQTTSYYSWTNTQIKVYVPSGVASGIIQAVVYVAAKASNPMNFTASGGSSNGTMWRYDLARTGNYPNGPTALPLNLKWQAYDAAPSNHASPIIANNILYVAIDKSLFAFDPNTGSKKWVYINPNYVNWGVCSPAIANGILYIGDNNAILYAIDATNGSLKWKKKISDIYWFGSSPVIFNSMVYFGQGDKVYALDANTGDIKWTYTATGEAFDYAPAIANGIIYIASDCKVYALNANTGGLKWVYSPSSGEWFAGAGQSLVVSNGIVYLGSGIYKKVYALDVNTGTIKWTFSVVGAAITSSCAIDKDRGILYFGDANYKLYALDANTGTLKWVYQDIYKSSLGIMSSPSISNGIVYFGEDSKLCALDAATGVLKWSYDLGKDAYGYYAEIHASPAIWNGKVYISAFRKGVYCFGQ
jgi:outer membrane protein assembly factor BamB